MGSSIEKCACMHACACNFAHVRMHVFVFLTPLDIYLKKFRKIFPK